MKLLVIGGGGREHALVWKLAQNPEVTTVWCAPGNAGTESELLHNGRPVQNAPIKAEAIHELAEFALAKQIDFTVVGPDNPLALGIVDHFQSKGLFVWGPNQKAAQFESSKAFSQDFMARHNIPTAKAGNFTELSGATTFAKSLDWKCAVKADGLALGKGVLICRTELEVRQALDEILVKAAFGEAGKQVVIQELLEGMEISLHALCDGASAKLFPTSQDHKRIGENDQGLNTGGMGTYCPTPFLDKAGLARAQTEILDRWVAGCKAESIDFRGIIYPGVMLTADGPKVLEFNARFGDPETQVYMMQLNSDLLTLLQASANGNLAQQPMEWRPGASMCVVLASQGYPGNYEKGAVIHGLDEVEKMVNVKVFHAGTARKGSDYVTAGGRVLGVTAWGENLEAAKNRAYEAVSKIRFDGMQFRRDIAAKALL